MDNSQPRSSVTQEQSEAEPITLVAELWYEQAPDLADPELLDALRDLSSEVYAQQGSITVPYSRPDDNGPNGGPAPLVTVVMPSSPLGEGGKSRPDASQTWDWEEAEAAVARSKAGVLVTEMLVSGWSAQDRVDALTRVVVALARVTRPLAV